MIKDTPRILRKGGQYHVDFLIALAFWQLGTGIMGGIRVNIATWKKFP